MNNRAAVERIRLLVDKPQLAERLVSGINRDPKGLKTNIEMVRLLLIGVLLAIEECQTATITGAYKALTERMDIRDQIRLGIKVGPGTKDFINRDRLYYAADLVCKGLAYGRSVEFEVTLYERERRHEVLMNACHALLDYTAEATEVDDTEIAIDATAIWGWSKGKYLPKPSRNEIDDQTDELFKAALIELAGGRGNTDDLEGAVVTDDPTKLGDLDPDSAWCGATSKYGDMKRFYGKYAHALVAVPRGKIKDDPNTRSPIVRRLELTRATGDLIEVTLPLIDSLGGDVKAILVDRHYSYKNFTDWQRALIQRGIRQVLDLRSDDHKALRYPEATYVDGFAHCPAMPEEHLNTQRPGIFATNDEHHAFQQKMEVRKTFAHVVINQMNEDGKMKLRCPARAFAVACPLFPPSMNVAAELGLTIINTDLLGLEPGQEPPRSCTQDTFRVTLPEQTAKLNQINYWGSVAWYVVYGLRTYVEGVFGNMKNPRTENLRRGTIQKNGLVWAQLVLTLMSATYNVRVIRSRHDRMENDPISHELLMPDEETVTHLSLSAEQEASVYAALFGQVNANPVSRKFRHGFPERPRRSLTSTSASPPAEDH